MVWVDKMRTYIEFLRLILIIIKNMALVDVSYVLWADA